MADRVPQNAWRPMSPQNMGLSPNPSIRGFGNQLLPRSGDLGMPLNPVRTDLMVLLSILSVLFFMIVALTCEM